MMIYYVNQNPHNRFFKWDTLNWWDKDSKIGLPFKCVYQLFTDCGINWNGEGIRNYSSSLHPDEESRGCEVNQEETGGQKIR